MVDSVFAEAARLPRTWGLFGRNHDQFVTACAGHQMATTQNEFVPNETKRRDMKLTARGNVATHFTETEKKAIRSQSPSAATGPLC
ncbi:hypothetical protein CIHG_04275 [Coccidioides immitis H538.4]|uniref:Uncharacterized protein n=3 Tax=Coccidioides immitis TaxID=5501 RepID=A0A0J8R811_COCIT|nr:hypothetical protein CIRG_09204 [Coccidioides immitis RMSCC 2394]KMU81134.1 hypothetical protein CISG_02511 [Coccidioides immitis RMSCC 3703]KMU86486.1 hypothetical protein CIHG_04275 [Coccidioides immitis H538.4]